MSRTLRFTLTRKADRLACSYGCESAVTITIIPKRNWLARIILGNPYACLGH